VRVSHFNGELERYGLPLLERNETPIFFIRGGPTRMTFALIQRLASEGFFATAAAYPVVPLKNSGVRVSITRHHSLDDLSAFAQALDHHYPKALDEVGLTREDVDREFDYHADTERRSRTAKLGRFFDLAPTPVPGPVPKPVALTPLTLETSTSIEAIDPVEWDALVGHRANLSHATLRSFEAIFHDRPEPESNWGWHYYVVRGADRPVAATFFTNALWKDDMLMRAEVSDRIEQMRESDPYFLTSRAFSMGSLLTEGNHLFLDRNGPWQEAMMILLEAAARAQREVGATSLVLRDLPEGDAAFDALLLEHGLVKMPTLAGHVLDLTAWTTENEFFATLGSRTRRRVRAEVQAFSQQFTVRLWRHGQDPTPTEQEFAHFYWLYKQVKDRKRRLNTFDLPTDVVRRLWETPGWELMSLYLSPEEGGPADGSAVALGINFLQGDHMVAVICGLDQVQREVSVYRQLLWRTVLRAKEAGAKTLELGMDAEREKTRLGAVPRPQCAYVQLTDHYSAELMGLIAQAVALGA
jgi:predicted N-acyltransferase